MDQRQLEEHIKEAEIAPPLRKIFKVLTTTNNAVVGHIELDRISRRDRCATLSRVLLRDGSLRGKGIGTKMVNKALKIGFDELGLHRIDLGVYDFNEKAIGMPPPLAIACYEKIGFIKEGYLQDARRMDSEYWSIYRMRILEDEWRKIY